MTRLLARLRRDERGLAAIEFALWSSVLFFTMLGASDFALWRTYQMRLSSAVQQAGMIAMRAPTAVNGTTLQTFVQSAAALPGTVPTVAVTCNGTTAACVNSNRAYMCASGTTRDSYAVPPTGSLTAGASCTTPANTTAGYYMTISARYGFKPLVLPRRWLSSASIADKVTVRLE